MPDASFPFPSHCVCADRPRLIVAVREDSERPARGVDRCAQSGPRGALAQGLHASDGRRAYGGLGQVRPQLPSLDPLFVRALSGLIRSRLALRQVFQFTRAAFGRPGEAVQLACAADDRQAVLEPAHARAAGHPGASRRSDRAHHLLPPQPEGLQELLAVHGLHLQVPRRAMHATPEAALRYELAPRTHARGQRCADSCFRPVQARRPSPPS